MALWTPQGGMDRLALLPAPCGATYALAGTHANHASGTDDLMVAFSAYFKRTATPSYSNLFRTGAGMHIPGYFNQTGYLYLYINVTTFQFLYAIPQGKHDIAIFIHRTGRAYLFVDSVPVADVDVSGEAAYSFVSTTLNICYGTDRTIEMIRRPRLYVISPANFPGETERQKIASELHQAPDVESPTLAARPGYATEKRIDLPMVDEDGDGTTLTNSGTGSATFSIAGGAGWHWHDVRGMFQHAVIDAPPEDWFGLDGTHTATVTADLGNVQGSYIMEVLLHNLRGRASGRIVECGSGAVETLHVYENTAGTVELDIRSNSVNVYHYIEHVQYGNFRWIAPDLNVLHLAYDADANLFKSLFNGQQHRSQAVVADLNLSGARTYSLASAAMQARALALRLWNAASVTADWKTIARRRVKFPWRADDGFSGMSLKGNWEGRIDSIQPASSTTVKNRANLGVGDMLISGAGTFGASTRLAVRGGY